MVNPLAHLFHLVDSHPTSRESGCSDPNSGWIHRFTGVEWDHVHVDGDSTFTNDPDNEVVGQIGVFGGQQYVVVDE